MLLLCAAQAQTQGSGSTPAAAAESGGLAERVTALTAEAEALAEEGLSKDEEIEALEGRLAHAAKARIPSVAWRAQA